ncbi:hypothetical protein ACJJTC_003554 [Scirpophaga incertulas]
MESEQSQQNDISTLLESWQIPKDIIENFRNNGISRDDLPDLNQDHMKEICPQISYRIKLTKKINEYLESTAPTVSISTLDGDSGLTAEKIVGEENSNITISLSDLFPDATSLQPSFPDFDLRTLLETSPCGKSILNFYISHGKLDSKRKNRLTDIIIRHLFTYIINKRLSYEDYNILTGKIITLFPKETAGTYFTRPIKKKFSTTGKSIPARGKLIDKVRNFLFQSRDIYKEIHSEDTPLKRQATNDLLLSIHDEDIEFLNNNLEPWSEIKEKWSNTVQVRHDLEYTDVHDFVSKWKVLKLPSAAELIEIDFSVLYPDKVNRFKDYWKLFMKNLIELKKEEIQSEENKKNLFMSLCSLDTEDQKLPTELTLLINIVPPKGRVSKTGKFSTQECLDSIMIIVENPGDINATIQRQIEKGVRRKINVQPYIILLGTMQKVSQAYIVIDNIRYTFDSATTAFDILFKSFHVLNARYPRPSDHIHLIIQRCVYDIYTKFDNPVPYISDILAMNI